MPGCDVWKDSLADWAAMNTLANPFCGLPGYPDLRIIKGNGSLQNVKKSSAYNSLFVTAVMGLLVFGSDAKAGGFSVDDSAWLEKSVAPQEMSDQSEETADPDRSRTNLEELIRDRSAEYEQVRKQAERDGTLGGALRGALIGGALTGEVVGVVGGAVLGAVAGSYTSKNVASRIITEHQNYSMRRWSLEQVIEAAKFDSQNTHFDLMLTRNYFIEDLDNGQIKPSAEALDDISLLAENATLRMLTIHEIRPLFSENAEMMEGLEAELAKQQSFVNEFKTMLESVK